VPAGLAQIGNKWESKRVGGPGGGNTGLATEIEMVSAVRPEGALVRLR